jgi:hypothetical protein
LGNNREAIFVRPTDHFGLRRRHWERTKVEGSFARSVTASTLEVDWVEIFPFPTALEMLVVSTLLSGEAHRFEYMQATSQKPGPMTVTSIVMPNRRAEATEKHASRLPIIAPKDDVYPRAPHPAGSRINATHLGVPPRVRLPPRSRTGCWSALPSFQLHFPRPGLPLTPFVTGHVE